MSYRTPIKTLEVLLLRALTVLALAKIVLGALIVLVGGSGPLLEAASQSLPPLAELWSMLAFGAAAVLSWTHRPAIAALLALAGCAFTEQAFRDIGFGGAVPFEAFFVPTLWLITLGSPKPLDVESPWRTVGLIMLAVTSLVALISVLGMNLGAFPSPFSNDDAHWGTQVLLGFPALAILGARCLRRQANVEIYTTLMLVAVFPMAVNMLIAVFWPHYAAVLEVGSMRLPVVLWLSVAPIAVLVLEGRRLRSQGAGEAT